VLVAALPVPGTDGAVELRASLSRQRDTVRAHLRTWYRDGAGRWHPTRRGVAVEPAQLGELVALVTTLERAYVAGALPGSATEPDTTPADAPMPGTPPAT